MLRSALTLLLAAVLVAPALAEGTGRRFTVTVTSSATPMAVEVTTWLQDGKVRTESRSGDATTVTITAEGKTYMLEAGLKLAQVAPVRAPGANVKPEHRVWWKLVDPLQVAPDQLPALFRELGARSLGTDTLDRRQVEALALTVPTDVPFPLSNLRLYVDATTGQPVRLDYQRGREDQVQVRFGQLATGLTLDSALFTVPADYRLIEYEW